MISGLSKEINFKKDVFYDFMKNSSIDWRRIVYLFYKQVASLIAKQTQEKGGIPKCLIVDDSLLPKSGKCIEFIGKVYDHCSHTYSIGMKLLVLGCWDGKSFMPLDFSLHNEPGKTKKRGLKEKELKILGLTQAQVEYVSKATSEPASDSDSSKNMRVTFSIK